MYRSAVIIILAAALAVILLIVCTQALVVVEMLAVIDEQQGPAHVLRGDEARSTAVGMLVRAGERIRTGSGGQVGLHWADGSRIEVGPDSELVIKRCRLNKSRQTRDSHFRLNLGEVWIRIQSALNPGSKFEVETPTIVAAVRGTIFGLKVFRDGTTRLQVYQGQVDILGNGDGQEVVESGASGRGALIGKGRLEVQLLSQAELERWQTKGDLIGPMLQVAEPAPRSTTSIALAPVSGRTENLAAVTVNGERVEVSYKGSFRSRARLAEGPNIITVIATMGRLQPTKISREITYVNPTRVIALTSRPSEDPRDPAGTMEVTAVLRDADRELVPDGTPLEFSASRGAIFRSHRTSRGAVAAKWRIGQVTTPASVTAVSGQATATAVTGAPAARGTAAPELGRGAPLPGPARR